MTQHFFGRRFGKRETKLRVLPLAASHQLPRPRGARPENRRTNELYLKRIGPRPLGEEAIANRRAPAEWNRLSREAAVRGQVQNSEPMRLSRQRKCT